METETTQAPGCSKSIAALSAALAKAQGQMKAAAKDAVNPHFRSKYADLASVWEACRGPLSANGLAVMQRVRTSDAGVTVVTMLTHSSGEWVADEATYPLAQRTPQAIGSAITYARRYALSALVGVAADEDDDGNAASGRDKPQKQESKPTQTPKASSAPDAQSETAKPTQTPAVRARFRSVYNRVLSTGMSTDQLQVWVATTVGRTCPSNELTADEVGHLENALQEMLNPAQREPGADG